jgi:hypothetical protein
MSFVQRIMNSGFTNETPAAFKERTKLGVEFGEGNTLNPNLRVPTWEPAPNEKWITQEFCNAYITIGHDRPTHLFSGYGGNAGTECSTIDICAGSASSLRKGAMGKKSFGKQDVIGKLFANDASRIYISQQTDVDKNFGLPKGKSPDTTGQAAIAVKSDFVRVIGRAGIKMYAGKGAFDEVGWTGEKSARAANFQHVPIIEFIASDPAGLQPLVRGDNLIRCLAAIFDHISRINQALLLYDKAALTLRASAILNFHPSTPVVTFPDPINVVTQVINMVDEVSTVVNNAIESCNVEIDKMTYLGITTDHSDTASIKTEDYVLSANVYTT